MNVRFGSKLFIGVVSVAALHGCYYQERINPIVVHEVGTGSGDVCSLVYVTNLMTSFTTKIEGDMGADKYAKVYDQAHKVGIDRPALSYVISRRGMANLSGVSELGKNVEFGETASLSIPYAAGIRSDEQYASFELPIYARLIDIKRNGKPTGGTVRHESWNATTGVTPLIRLQVAQTPCDTIHLYRLTGLDLTEKSSGTATGPNAKVKPYKKKWNSGAYAVSEYTVSIPKAAGGRRPSLARVRGEIADLLERSDKLSLKLKYLGQEARLGVPASKAEAFDHARRLVAGEMAGHAMAEIPGLADVVADLILKD